MSTNFQSLHHFFEIYRYKFSPDTLNIKIADFLDDLRKQEFGTYDYFPFYVGGIVHEYKEIADKTLINDLLIQGIATTESFLERTDLERANRSVYDFLLSQLYMALVDELEAESSMEMEKVGKYLELAAGKITSGTLEVGCQDHMLGDVLEIYLLCFGDEGTDLSLAHEKRLSFLLNHSDSKEAYLDALTALAIPKPTLWKDSLQNYHEQHFDRDFRAYWLANLIKPDNNMAIAKPDLDRFMEAHGEKEKFLLVDFWGTWCGVCLGEMNHIEQLYQETISHPRLRVMTIACRDTEEKVNEYMAKNNYSFPVLVSDGSYQKIFDVQHYPTKLLISPSGEVMPIPGNGKDFYNLVLSYFGQ